MRNKILKQVGLVAISMMTLSTLCVAKSDSTNIVKLINIAGQQRMLSQRIAKDYLYSSKKIATSKANKQLKESMDSFLKIHKELVLAINDSEIKNLLDFVALSSDEFKVIARKDFDLDNAQLILDLSESMLEGSQYIVDSLKKSYKLKKSNLIGMSGKQRMLSQRIAKYYIAYQSGIKDENTINSMKDTVKQFSENLEILMSNKTNTPKINKQLGEINRLWKIVYKFYNNIEKGGLPLIVFNTTDNITKKMDEITKLYVAVYK